MRKLLAASVVLVMVAAGVGFAAVVLNRRIADNHDRIIEKVEAATGRRVGIGAIRVSLWPGLGMRFEDVHVGDNADAGSPDVVQVAAGMARARLWPLLSRRREARSEARDGVIKNLNIPDEILGHAARLPLVGDLVPSRIKPKYARLF